MKTVSLQRSAAWFGAVLLAALPLAGCGNTPDGVATVSGTVTLDGKPLPHAAIEFQPSAGGRPSFGETDEQGEYTLHYTAAAEGAEIGQHTVRVSTRNQITDPATGQTSEQPETLPAKYNVQSELTFQVKPGSNQADFDLTSG